MRSHKGNSLEPVGQTNSSLRAASWEAEGFCNPLRGAAARAKPGGRCREEGAHLASTEDKNEKGSYKDCVCIYVFLKKKNAQNAAEIKIRCGLFIYLKVMHYCYYTLLEKGFLLVPNEQRTLNTTRTGHAKCIRKTPLFKSNKKMFRAGDRALNGSIRALTAQPRMGSWRREEGEAEQDTGDRAHTEEPPSATVSGNKNWAWLEWPGSRSRQDMKD